ncbi:MAG: hypothetical protein HY596_00720 [Candidatus Omnitrophica bacterium]|nr:hypothetical protein [Candidatus Omnitrophota bacterium]
MQSLGKAALVLGVASLVIGIVSRLTYTPILGVESEAITKFAATCFLLSIAASLTVCHTCDTKK